MAEQDLMKKLPHKMTEDEIHEHRWDLMDEIAWAARGISETQKRIAELTERVETIELEFESREAKKNGLRLN